MVPDLFIVRSLTSSSSSRNQTPRHLLSICALCRSSWLGWDRIGLDWVRLGVKEPNHFYFSCVVKIHAGGHPQTQ